MGKNADVVRVAEDIEVRYLISLIRSAIREEASSPAPPALNWQRLYCIAKAHMVSALVYLPVEAAGGCPADLLAKWKQKTDFTLRKEVMFDVAREELFAAFDQNGIDYLPLKGIIIQNFYPRKGMRQFSDNDILIRKKDIMAADAIMAQLSYQVETGEWDDPSRAIAYRTVISYQRDKTIHFEIHNSLFYTWEDHAGSRGKFFKKWATLVDYFDRTWERAIKTEGANRAYYLSDEDFYFYFLVHFYKHYRMAGGAGFRSFVDFYLIKRHLNLNRDDINRRFQEVSCPDLELFEREAEEISEWLLGDSGGEISRETLQYVISSGAYGNPDNAIKADLKRRSRFAIVWEKIFPSVTGMKLRYNVLDQAPVLLPFFYIGRLFSVVFTAKRRNKLKAAIKNFFRKKKDKGK